ncbi:MAG: NAD(P)-dependent alcohol dehydrogenase [Euryarchaeota archaeon]|nr:NAD(P)-dependent alcohol dehydrogenase [Euryarchaeota archaeon]
MKAAVCQRYGPPEVVKIADVARPSVGDRDVLVRVRATTVTAGDWRLRSGNVPRGFKLILRLGFGIRRPRQPILGSELAGVVEEVGPAVRRFKPGDKVFALCGAKMGGHAQFVSIGEDAAIAHMPPNVSFEEAAALSLAGATALWFLRDKAKVKAGERVLINGASGGVGSAAVQIAKHDGAHVTAVCSSTNAGWVKALGAERVIDYTKEDFAKAQDRYDIIMDTVGNAPFRRCKPALSPGGRFLLVVNTLAELLGALVRPRRGTRRLIGGVAPERAEHLLALRELVESGAFRPHIERVFPFERIVDAYAVVDSGRKKGNVVVTL